MKRKIVLICSTVLIVTVTVCCSVLLNQTKTAILALTYRQAAEKQASLRTSFAEMCDYYTTEGDSQAVKRSLIHYCFTRFADSSAVLILDGETVYSVSQIKPEEYMELDVLNSQKQFTGKIRDKQYLIVGSQMRLGALPGANCSVYVVEDITYVYQNMHRMMWQFLWISSMCSIFGLGAIMVLVKRSMRPLGKLQKAASDIADGNYRHRADVNSRDEVGALAVSFNRMAQSVQDRVEELTETARRQQLFIGGVTHEFKTPLTAILLSADTLQNTYMTEEEQMDALARIEAQGKWLERLVQKMWKLLTINRDISLQTISVPELLRRVRESTSETLRSRDVSLEIHCDLQSLQGDPDLLQSALVNLVDNASKASSPGQVVQLRAFDNVLEVSDNGIGIPRESLEHVTDAFYMVDKSRSKKLGGAGLGLALVKEIAAAHGADMEIESELGHGTTVRIRFAQ
ncbi:MAG: HAMP domain-containing sensor histidine kinase [Eubacteriales bacterium]|nr:HAMP domain-containing sensor histidine kinase [Eubacteriales bacterium]